MDILGSEGSLSVLEEGKGEFPTGKENPEGDREELFPKVFLRD